MELADSLGLGHLFTDRREMHLFDVNARDDASVAA